MTKGWKRESARHSLARKGIKTGRKTYRILNPETLPTQLQAKNRKEAWKKLDEWLNTKVELKEIKRRTNEKILRCEICGEPVSEEYADKWTTLGVYCQNCRRKEGLDF